ncbi:protein phosphatase 1 regulatory subunit 37-like [Dendronephthya gigantea]|uniref:protein phosphatase 1 regulatory subunit 37-like n=1 Tax=Dendronephthya gigantea TaxID=151771 RepID=UPI00106B40AD|nr:protein phosphatase 1 regulatory subunit 37-like [Dendronephthya gigantea]
MDIDESDPGIFAGNGEGQAEQEDLSRDILPTLSRQGQVTQIKKEKKRRVSFPDDDRLVSKSVEPFDPWANALNATSTEVIKAYMNACARLRIKPIDKLVKQLKEHDVFQNRMDILDFKGIKLEIKSCEALEEVFKRVQVHTLDIENTSLEDEGAIAIIEMIEFYQSALHVCIGYNPRVKTRGWQIFSQMVRKADFIEYIDVRHCCFNDPCMAVMARSLKLNTTLRVVHLEGDNLSGKLLLILCTGIKFNQSVSELFLGDNFLISSDASTLSAMLRSNSTLQLLDVRNNMLQDQGTQHLCDGLAQQKSSGVRTLVLWNNQITRTGMISMANLLATTQNIQTLNIGHNRLGNDGIRNLQIGLLKNRSLLRLGLLNTKITAEGAVALAEYVADTRTLLRLDLRENDLFVGGLMALTLAVKINETVVRIDLDKDLKKEQGMERTQTSLLVDIYQYLERNKKLGVEREELRRQNDLEAEQLAIAQRLESDDNKDDVSNNEIESHCNSSGHNPDSDVIADVAPGDDVTIENDVADSSCNSVVDTGDSCGFENHVDGRSSRFIVSPVRDDNTELSYETEQRCLQGASEHFNNIIDELPNETSQDSLNKDDQLFNNAENIEEISDPEEFDKELDELLANVSGVKIDLSDLPKQDDTEEFWNKDMKEILESPVS